VTAHLKLKENATRHFFKPRPVPFALKGRIAEELKRLERIGVLEKVEFSDWWSEFLQTRFVLSISTSVVR